MKLKLIEKKEVATGTKEFIFGPQSEISWLPGQYYYWTLPKLTYPDPKGATRHFTIHLSPTESKNIGFTTRMRADSGFKQSLDKLKIGSEVDGEGPEGTFILDEAEKGPHVLIAGGIGITPYRSMIRYNIDKKTDTKIHLIYANSKPSEIAFKDELATWAKESKNITVDMTVSEPEGSWKGLTGRIDADMIKRLTKNYDLSTTTFWVCGPPGMVSAMEGVLGQLKLTSGQVRAEKFSGY